MAAYAKIAIYVTDAEYNDNGYDAQNLVAKELRNRLDNTDISYDVVEPTDTPSMGTEDPSCGSGLLNEWDNLVENCYVTTCGADSHLLITNSYSTAGCAESPGNSCVYGGGPYLAGTSSLDRYGYGNDFEAFNGCCQEIFHNFSVDHIHGDNNYVSSLDGYYLSPMMTGYKTDLCGQYNPCDSWIWCDSIDGYDTQWTECAESEAEAYLS